MHQRSTRQKLPEPAQRPHLRQAQGRRHPQLRLALPTVTPRPLPRYQFGNLTVSRKRARLARRGKIAECGEEVDEDGPLDHGAGPGPLSDGPEDRDRRGRRAAFSRRLRDLRPRQRHLPLRGAGGGEGRFSHLARAERAVDGARRGRLRQGEAPAADHGGALLDRPGRRQHDHRGGLRHGEPAAGALPRRRRLRQPPPRPGAAAGRALQQSDHDGERRISRRQPLLGPHHASGADHLVAAAGGRHHARPGRLRPGLPRPLPGHAGARLRLSGGVLRDAHPSHPPRAARPRRDRARRGAAEEGEEAARHRRRRRALFAGRGGADRIRRKRIACRSPRRSPGAPRSCTSIRTMSGRSA